MERSVEIFEVERAPPAGIIADDLAVSAKEVFVGHKTLETDRTAGMQLAGADADLGAEAVAESVSKAGGTVAVDTGGIHHLQEAAGSRVVAGENGIGVV